MEKPHIAVKPTIMAVLNGNSFAVVAALIPAALISQLLKALPQTGLVGQVEVMVALAQSTLPLIAAFVVGNMLRLSNLETASMALATFVASGVVTVKGDAYMIAGTGVILNIMLTTLIASYVARLSSRLLGQLRMVFEPLVVLLISGGIGLLTLPIMVAVQGAVGQVVAQATRVSPLLMGVLLGMLFAFLIVSPLSSVGIATAIGLSGVGSGAANAGIVAAAITLAEMGAGVNSGGAIIAHFMGSPKIQMANMLSHPKLFMPVLLAAGVSGGVASLLGMSGTAFSAGFGLSGFIGPLTALNESQGDLLGIRVILAFIVVPLLLGILMKLVFMKKVPLIQGEELALPDI